MYTLVYYFPLISLQSNLHPERVLEEEEKTEFYLFSFKCWNIQKEDKLIHRYFTVIILSNDVTQLIHILMPPFGLRVGVTQLDKFINFLFILFLIRVSFYLFQFYLNVFILFSLYFILKVGLLTLFYSFNVIIIFI